MKKRNLKLGILALLSVCVLLFVSCGNNHYIVENGIEFYELSSAEYMVVANITFWAGENVEIPAELNGLPVKALKDSSSFMELPARYKTLILPESIIYIYDSFYENASTQLQYNEYDNGLYLGTKDNPYFAFIKVKNVEIAETVSRIECAGEENDMPPSLPYDYNGPNAPSCVIHPDTKIIANNAFAGCQNLTEIVIPGGIKRIPAYAFAGCTSLKTVIIEEGVERIEESAFYDCFALSELSLPNSIKEFDNVFSNLSGLKSVTIPKSWTEIPDYTFMGCGSLEEIFLHDGITKIGRCAFENCKSLKSINLPNGLKSIEEAVFYGCTSLESIELPTSLESIGTAAFALCEKLTEIHIPKNVQNIEASFIRACTSISNITIDPENTAYVVENGAIYTKSKTTLLAFAPAYQLQCFIVPDTVNWIETNCFAHSSIEQIIIPEGVKAIEALAFSNCKNLKEVILPDSVTSIGQRLFENCTNLEKIEFGRGIRDLKHNNIGECHVKQVVISANLTDIDIEALVDFIGVEQFIVNEDNLAYKSIGGDLYSKNGQILYKYAAGKPDKEFTIPSGTKYIAERAFAGIENLETVTIPSFVAEIGEYAFSNGFGDRKTTSLINVTIENGVEKIGDGAFFHCEKLKTVEIPDSVTFMDTRAFSGCSSLESVKIGKGLTEIGYNAFQHCVMLSTVELGENIELIKSYAFNGCTRLNEVTIPVSVKCIEKCAFNGTMTFIYKGTKAQWRELQRNSSLFANTSIHYVYCTDGKMTVRG